MLCSWMRIICWLRDVEILSWKLISEDIPSDPVLRDSQPGLETPTLPTPVSSQMPRRSGSSIKAPEWYMYLGEVSEAVSETRIEDPTRYEEAVTDIDSCLWQTAMKAEMESLYSNQIWGFVDLPSNVCSIWCK